MRNLAGSSIVAIALVACAHAEVAGDRGDTGTGVRLDSALDANLARDAARVVEAATVIDAAVADVPVDVPPDVSREQFCMGAGPAIEVGDTTMEGARCAGLLAESVFRYAICTCSDLNLAGYLHTDAYDSSSTDMHRGNGGAVGINHGFGLVGAMRIGDSLTVAGTGSLNLVGDHEVKGDLAVNGPVTFGGVVEVNRNAMIAGNVLGLGLLKVHGNLLHPAGTVVLAATQIDGRTVTAPVAAAPPCACSASQIVDVGRIVDEGHARNDNAAAGVSQTMFDSVVGIVEFRLPCGRFYFDRVAGLGGIRLDIDGRVAIFIEGDFDLGGAFDIQLAPGAEVDVFVKGSILGAGYLRLGRGNRPAKTRFYIGGAQGFTLLGASGFYGNLYAPHAAVTLAGYMNLWGSVFGHQVFTAGDLDVHYDRSVLHAGDMCPPPATGCFMCDGTCSSTQGCINGACAPCRSDADCCAPLLCNTDVGQCEPIPL